jgi:hypothetical protein
MFHLTWVLGISIHIKQFYIPLLLVTCNEIYKINMPYKICLTTILDNFIFQNL